MQTDRPDIVQLIRQFIASHSGKAIADIPEYPTDRDLFEHGDLDSFGFVELLSFLGDRTGRHLDLSDVDPAELTIVGNLVAQFADGDGS